MEVAVITNNTNISNMSNISNISKVENLISKNDFLESHANILKIIEQTENIILGKKDVIKMTIISLFVSGAYFDRRRSRSGKNNACVSFG